MGMVFRLNVSHPILWDQERHLQQRAMILPHKRRRNRAPSMKRSEVASCKLRIVALVAARRHHEAQAKPRILCIFPSGLDVDCLRASSDYVLIFVTHLTPLRSCGEIPRNWTAVDPARTENDVPHRLVALRLVTDRVPTTQIRAPRLVPEQLAETMLVLDQNRLDPTLQGTACQSRI